MCLYPKLVRNPKYVSNKKNGGVIPPINDNRVIAVPIGCGNCMECRKQKMNSWGIRLMEEVKEKRNGKFVTLTFSNESIRELSKGIKLKGYDLDNAIATRAVRLFTERWRKKYKKTIRHFLITELGHGKTEHLHLHGIVWAGNEDDVRDTMNEIEDKWKYGWVWKGKEVNGRLVNYVNEKTVNYIGKYIMKIDEQHKEYKPIILCSNGIGKGYINRAGINNEYKGKETKDSYKLDNGTEVGLPIYYRNKLYSDEEKEALWINKLDKELRYVNKIEIDISEGYEDYFKVLEEERRVNIKMGYGTSKIEWERKQYEKELRMIKHESRGIKREMRNKDYIKMNKQINKNSKWIEESELPPAATP
jgi:hypothetical protein